MLRFYISFTFLQTYKALHFSKKGNDKEIYMKATHIVRRIDDLGRVVIPKEIRRTMHIREGDPPHNSLTPPRKVLYGNT